MGNKNKSERDDEKFLKREKLNENLTADPNDKSDGEREKKIWFDKRIAKENVEIVAIQFVVFFIIIAIIYLFRRFASMLGN